MYVQSAVKAEPEKFVLPFLLAISSISFLGRQRHFTGFFKITAIMKHCDHKTLFEASIETLTQIQ